jgi:haloalkane dehalogenase
MWRHLMQGLAAAGWRSLAPDFAGFGDSASRRPHTWERHVEDVGRFHEALELGEVALVVHDWGGLIGLAWACENPRFVRALVVSSTGFFPDGKWHGVAQVARTPGEGEEMVDGMTREGFGELLRANGKGFDDEVLDEYWRCFGDEDRRRGQLDFFRSMDFEKLAPYDGKLGELGVPTLILWGESDPFAFMPSAYRFEKEIPGAKLVIVEGTAHFVWEDDPERTTGETVDFLSGI